MPEEHERSLVVLAHLARYDARTLDGELLAVVELQHGILDDERPHLVARAVVVQVTLRRRQVHTAHASVLCRTAPQLLPRRPDYSP